MRLDSSVVQIDCYDDKVLASTHTRSYLCFTSKQQFKHIGTKLRWVWPRKRHCHTSKDKRFRTDYFGIFLSTHWTAQFHQISLHTYRSYRCRMLNKSQGVFTILNTLRMLTVGRLIGKSHLNIARTIDLSIQKFNKKVFQYSASVATTRCQYGGLGILYTYPPRYTCPLPQKGPGTRDTYSPQKGHETPVNRETNVKTLPSRNCVCRRQ